VVDFIDMLEKRNNTQVERCLRDALREDKAKIQVGTISGFGLLELSRQRPRSSIADANMIQCPHCNGMGFIWSNESIAIQVLRKIEESISVMNCSEITVTLSMDVATYLMNYKRSFITSIEEKYGSKINFKIDASIAVADFKMEQTVHHITKENDASSSQNSSEKTSPKKTNTKEKNANSDVTQPKNTKEKVEEKVEEEIPEVITLATGENNKKPRRNSRNRRRKNHRNRLHSETVESTTAFAEHSEPPEPAPVEQETKLYSIITDDDSLGKDLAIELNMEELSKRTSELFALHEAVIASTLNSTDQYKKPENILVEKSKIQSKRQPKEKNKWWQQLIKKPE
jgi:ribonuclease E